MTFLHKATAWLRRQPRSEEAEGGVERFDLNTLRMRHADFANRRRGVEAGLVEVKADLERLIEEWAALRCNATKEQREEVAGRRHFLAGHHARLEKQRRRLQKRCYILETACALVEDRQIFSNDVAERTFWDAIHAVIAEGLAEEQAQDYRLDETMGQIAHADRASAAQRESWIDDEIEALDRALSACVQGGALSQQLASLREEIGARVGEQNAGSSHWQDAGMERAR